MPKELLKDQQKPVLTQMELNTEYNSRDIYINTQFEKNTEYFHIMGHEESHAIRRKEILAKHPEIKLLFGSDQASIWVALTCLLTQLISCSYFSQCNIYLYIASAYCIGGFASHSIQILVHDLTHFTCFDSILANKLFAIIAGAGTGFPSAITFGRYHQDHHTYMNLVDKDPDLPSQAEIRLLKSPLAKLLFLNFQIFFYALRPLLCHPKQPTKLEALNWIYVVIFDFTIYYNFGIYALLWIWLSTMLGMGLHPVSGHVIAEHYEFVNRLETCDYIGWANFFNINVGYHTEHHDFPMIPWTRLPLVRKMAPEFYEHLPHHTSYWMAFYHYVTDNQIGPFSRIVREKDE